MGSERLSHMFAAKDPAYKDSSLLSKFEAEKSSSHRSIFHASGTHPVLVGHSKKLSSSLSSIKKLKSKQSSKDKKLLKLYSRQLSHIETSLDAIESLTKSNNTEHIKILLSFRKQLNKLNQDLENLRYSSSEEDNHPFDRIKIEIEQFINDLKSYKINDDDTDSKNSIDYIVNFPLGVSDSENDEEIISMSF
ncbi:unnamed protein product [Rotaria sp. Silwood1]|nr:unnamed protein product [Rotaria sp. Silwood1]CAF3467925.1 unnamed protein product [Rotaria sp. Silwood1]CAF3508243.1 unnamed protein product [Rotaria sp. Silwood1]CAF3535527.1 unnamed protein product [Rotaria sp. Silwood1]CAF3542927.1 unnamed protein product [Rotaria sp. Silwood1]